MWAFGCGIVSVSRVLHGRWVLVAAGVFLCGPLFTGTSQAVNDWFDRQVNAISEPGRAVPSGRVPGHGGLSLALLWSTLSLVMAISLGGWAFGVTVEGLALAWSCNTPPLRLKLNGWLGNAACGAEARARVMVGADEAKSSAVARQWMKGADKIPFIFVYHEILRELAYAKDALGRLFEPGRCDIFWQGQLFLPEPRKRFMKAHGQVFLVLGTMQRFRYSSDKRRENFVAMCRDPDVPKMTWQSHMSKNITQKRPLARGNFFFKDLAYLFGVFTP